jgi:hypothetical protein
MKLVVTKLLVFLAGLSVLGAADRPQLADVTKVYLLPMTYALDQFLAIRLTKGGQIEVVTDPKQADAILTDHIGSNLEEKMNTLYGEKQQPEAVQDKDKDKNKQDPPSFAGPMAGSSRTRGAVFLVDRRTRGVVWSDYVRPKNSQPDELHHVADKIATQLEKDKKGK